MYFNSLIFLFVFLPLTFAGYYLCGRFHRLQMGVVFLSLASLTFYAYFKVEYLWIISTSIIVNYLIGIYLSESKRRGRKEVLIAGISFNLGLLGFYKYTDFLIQNVNTFFEANIPARGILLPLAISFFTFQQIAYLVDSYHHEIKERNFFNYVLFITFFPQLIAGPIVHHKEMMPQFADKRAKFINWNHLADGLQIFILGLTKKVLIADTLAKWVDTGFSNAIYLDWLGAWITSLAYTFQLYFDFSGYCDMAIGIALMFNIKLPINFNSPYKAVNIQDFWRRWHITLSRWLKDYLYIPLGGNRKGAMRTYLNLFVVFFLGGVWHGAGWTFVIWGALHGLANVVYRFYKEKLSHIFLINKYVAWLITFLFVNMAWVFFRATSVEQAQIILTKMYLTVPTFYWRLDKTHATDETMKQALNQIDSFCEGSHLLMLIGILLCCVFIKNSMEYNRKQTIGRAIGFGILLTVCLWKISLPNVASPFLYFNF